DLLPVVLLGVPASVFVPVLSFCKSNSRFRRFCAFASVRLCVKSKKNAPKRLTRCNPTTFMRFTCDAMRCKPEAKRFICDANPAQCVLDPTHKRLDPTQTDAHVA